MTNFAEADISPKVLKQPPKKRPLSSRGMFQQKMEAFQGSTFSLHTSDLLCPSCSSSAADSVITECPSDTSTQIQSHGLTCSSSSCFWEQTSLLRCFAQASLTVHGLQNLLMLPVSVLFESSPGYTQRSTRTSSASASTRKPALGGNFPAVSGSQRSAGNCRNVLQSPGCTQQFPFSVLLHTDSQSMQFQKAAHEIALLQGETCRFPCVSEHSLLLSLPGLLGQMLQPALMLPLGLLLRYVQLPLFLRSVSLLRCCLKQVFLYHIWAFGHLRKCP